MVPDSSEIQAEAQALCALARWCSTRGWLPATSGNFSLRSSNPGHIHVSPSGIDKAELTPEHLAEMTPEGRVLDEDKKPSAEAALHVVIYRARPDVRAIAHVHTVWSTLISSHFAAEGCLSLHGYELLKALSGVTSHWHCERIPILQNSQNSMELTQELSQALSAFPFTHGVLLSAHGLYTWGSSVSEVRRHLEALEFLFEVEGRRVMGHWS